MKTKTAKEAGSEPENGSEGMDFREQLDKITDEPREKVEEKKAPRGEFLGRYFALGRAERKKK
jgi:hypothetical protein